MKIYVEHDTFKCHSSNPDGTFREVENQEAEFFTGKCETFVEGYCYDDSKGYVQIYPWKPYDELDDAQREYERAQLAQKDEIIAELDTLVLNLQYNNLKNN